MQSLNQPVIPGSDPSRRAHMQQELGRHISDQRRRMIDLIHRWIETDIPYPLPIYNRRLDRIKALPPELRADIAVVCEVMADNLASALLAVFDGGIDRHIDDYAVNYAIIAQLFTPESDLVIEQIDINRGQPSIALWNEYKRWKTRL
jgi:hypothetical protein